MTCPVCATVTVPGARFCHHCGTALPTEVATPLAERRVVTVLFGDLSEFTAWAEGVDPERVGAVTDRVLGALAGAVKTFGGHVDKLTGDGIMAVFGAPVAHEDDPERAARAALAMQRAVRRVLDEERGGGAPAGLRIGINTGEVVAGLQAALEYTVIGDTVNTAARLADAAGVGGVYAGAATQAATRHVAAWRRLLPLRLKGKRQAVEAYELLGPLDAPDTRSSLGDEGPFVGREAEMALVASRLAEVADRATPRVLVFTADAGLGKSRLAAEVGRFAAGFNAAQTGGARVLAVRCEAYGERWRLGPLADLVRAALGLPDNGGPVAGARAAAEERLRRVAAMVARRTGAPAELPVDALLALLGLADATAAEDPLGGVTSGSRGEEPPDPASAAVAALLTALAVEAPLVITVDDLHNASPQTVDALGATLGTLAGPVLLVVFGRPEMVRSTGALTRLADAEVHPLPPLRGADVSRLLSAYLGGGRLTPEETERLLRTSQGNPFYLAELVTLLMERGALHRLDGAWRLAPDSLQGGLLSRDLAAVLAARIDALPAESRAVLRDAAVVGDTVPAAALRAVHGSDAGPDQEPALDELLNRRMLMRTRTGYAFATPLLREAAYAGVGKADLSDRHARLARWAAQLPPLPVPSVGWTAEARDAFVADQAERAAGLAEVMWLRPEAPAREVAPLGVAAMGRLARRAIRAGEPAQAAHLGDRALELGGELDPADRLVHASALLQLRRVPAALAEAERVIAQASVGPPSPAVGLPSPAVDPADLARALLLAGRAHQLLGEAQRGDAALGQALRVATEANLATERAEALRRIGLEEFQRGQLAAARRHNEEALAVSTEAGDRRGEAWALQNLAWVTTTLGEFETTDATLARADQLFTDLGDTSGRAWMSGATAFSRLLAGRLDEARRLARTFLPFGERVGAQWAVGTLRAVGAFAAAELGDLTAAEREARAALREFDAAGDDWGRGLALAVRGEIARSRGDSTTAGQLLTSACELADRAGHPLLVGLAHTLRGFASLDRGDPAAASAAAEVVLTAVAPLDATEAAWVGPRVLLGLARLALGEVDGAVGALAPVAADSAPSLLLGRAQALAAYSTALLAAGRCDEALATARRAAQTPIEAVRGQVAVGRALARALAATGHLDEAVDAARGAADRAHATEESCDRDAADALLAELSAADRAPAL